MNNSQMWKGLVLGAVVGYAAVKANRARRRISFRNRTVVVAGGSRGLGLALARMLVAEGARVVILARAADELERALSDLKGQGNNREVMALVCDVSHQQEVNDVIEQVVATWGRIDVVFNVAGIIQVGPWEHMLTRDFEQALDVHLWGPLNMMRACIPFMQLQKFGRIVNVASVGGTLGMPHMLPYAASKAALIGLSGGIQSEVSKHGIRVTTVVPGLIRTGSHVNAQFKGQHGKEFAWFASADSLWGVSLSAERAAKQILEACRYGDFYVSIGWAARLAQVVQAVAPNATAQALVMAELVMPGQDGHTGDESQPGWKARAELHHDVRHRADDAVSGLNEQPQTHKIS